MKQALIGIAGGLFAGLVALGLMFSGPLGSGNEPVAQEPVSQSPTATPVPTQSETVSESAELAEEIIACSVSELEQAPGMLELQAQVLRADTGEVLFDRASATPARAASIMKLFTAAAALETLGPDYRVTTRVYVDELDPSIIYLIGAGEDTLSRAVVKQASVY
jgi:D-alanyl-D-alanine carboxypeptidase/D-alanyl-D-alanine-endopeptidase (penicillin-binding protein 4)